MTTTFGLGLTEHASAGANGHVTANEAYRVLELFSSVELAEFQLVAAPGSPVEGALYVVGTAGTGAFSGHDGELALFLNAAWRFIPPKSGMQLMVASGATHDFSKIMIAYSAIESEWFPVQPFAAVGTSYWTGRYFDTGAKLLARKYVGTINTGTSQQSIAHSVTPDFTKGAWVDGYIFDDTAEKAGSMPGRIPNAQVGLHVDDTNIQFQPTASLGSNYEYVLTLWYFEA